MCVLKKGKQQMRFPLFVINLADARPRMDAVHQRLEQTLGDIVQIQRVDAVDGRNGNLSLGEADLSTRSHYFIVNRSELPDIMTLHSREAVGNLRSHQRCWQRMVTEDIPVGIVCEDDVCPRPDLKDWLESDGLALLSHASDWDYVVIGFETFPFKHTPSLLEPVTVGDVEVYRPLSGIHQAMFGAHCYMVSRDGAAKLLRNSSPMEMHTDYFLFISASLRTMRGFVARRHTLAHQCHLSGKRRALFEFGGHIPHFQWDQINTKVILPDVTLRTLFIVLVSAVLLWLGYKWIPRKNRQ
jgi:GR25 family glycosyltransferase involved in LPS biosynthesis